MNNSLPSPPSENELNNNNSLPSQPSGNELNELNNSYSLEIENSSNTSSETENTSEVENNNVNMRNQINLQLYYLIKIHNIIFEMSYYVFHTFLLSIFEVIFYWLYIADQERTAIVNKANTASKMLEPLCISFKLFDNSQYNDSFDNIINNLKNKNKRDNINYSLKPGIIISIFIFLVYFLLQIIFYYVNLYLKDRITEPFQSTLSVCLGHAVDNN